MGFAALAIAEVPTRKLFMIGGGDRPREVMESFVTWTGAKSPKILVIGWASETLDQTGAYLIPELLAAGAKEVWTAPARAELSTAAQVFAERVKAADGIFFGGGDQNRILDSIEKYDFTGLLRDAYEAGKVLGGTSAGTAIMSKIAITGEGDFQVIDGKKVETRAGLGLVTRFIVDQHFLVKKRLNRLLGLVQENPSQWGVGIDEATALLVENECDGRVLGNSQVTVIQGATPPSVASASAEFRVQLFASGSSFRLP